MTKISVDLAIDRETGDLLVSASNDIELVTGVAETQQRISLRLRVQKGSWLLDPSGGELGSTLVSLTRTKIEQALASIPLLVREALAPMEDIRVEDVDASIDPDVPTRINFVVFYSPVLNDAVGDPTAYTDSIEVTV
jgi:hypothetical protein